MPKVSEKERIAKIEEKLKQLKAVQNRKEARARSVDARRTRREEMRRKFLVGAIVLAKIEDGSLDKKVLNGWLQTSLTKHEDRALFELDG
jgi:large subunit ribosomal protein L7/L12